MTTTTPTRATNFLTGLSTLLLIVTIAFGAFVLVGHRRLRSERR